MGWQEWLLRTLTSSDACPEYWHRMHNYNTDWFCTFFTFTLKHLVEKNFVHDLCVIFFSCVTLASQPLPSPLLVTKQEQVRSNHFRLCHTLLTNCHTLLTNCHTLLLNMAPTPVTLNIPCRRVLGKCRTDVHTCTYHTDKTWHWMHWFGA